MVYVEPTYQTLPHVGEKTECTVGSTNNAADETVRTGAGDGFRTESARASGIRAVGREVIRAIDSEDTLWRRTEVANRAVAAGRPRKRVLGTTDS